MIAKEELDLKDVHEEPRDPLEPLKLKRFVIRRRDGESTIVPIEYDELTITPTSSERAL